MQAGCLNHCEGSPPRMRGKALHLNSYLIRQRITPAHAGKSITAYLNCSLKGDHPRACGEKPHTFDFAFVETGSPPRMRGKAARYAGPLPCQRITPAHAGKRGCSRSARRIRRDHPRACGEKCAISLVTIGKPGSPPRMRGKVQSNRQAIPGAGITPAHAGKSPEQKNHQRQNRDHPRACGEKCKMEEQTLNELGSPPRMRGKAEKAYCGHFPGGITPAHAGKRSQERQDPVERRDHPRACGEKSIKHIFASCPVGSPPRMRGKAMADDVGHTMTRITPAHAGKRSTPSPPFCIL